MDGEQYYSPNEQTRCFSKYFEDLSVPKDDGYDSAFMDLTNIRANLIEQICDGNNSEMDPISESEVDKAIKKLNSNKAADEFGLGSRAIETIARAS